MGSDTAPDLIAQDEGDPSDVVLASANDRSGGDRRYHNDGCLRARRIDQTTRMTREQAQEHGFIPCRECHTSVEGGTCVNPRMIDLLERVRESMTDN